MSNYSFLFAIIALIGIILFMWGIIDACLRNFAKPKDQVFWLVLLVVGIFLTASLPIIPIIYLIYGRRKGVIRQGLSIKNNLAGDKQNTSKETTTGRPREITIVAIILIIFLIFMTGLSLMVFEAGILAGFSAMGFCLLYLIGSIALLQMKKWAYWVVFIETIFPLGLLFPIGTAFAVCIIYVLQKNKKKFS